MMDTSSHAGDYAGYLRCQRLALKGAEEISGFLRPGWTEKRAALMLESYLRDHGVESFFHRPFVWFGERSRFDGIQNYFGFAPTDRVLLDGESYILDVAPILDGYTCDIGFSATLAPHAEYAKAMQFLIDLRERIPQAVQQLGNAKALCAWVDGTIHAAGFDPIHHRYPFGVLGHRIHRVEPRASGLPVPSVMRFGWQSYWQLLSRGLVSQLLRPGHRGKIQGLWAVEPHLGGKGFGAKFEEILVVEETRSYWLSEGEKHVDGQECSDHWIGGRNRLGAQPAIA